MLLFLCRYAVFALGSRAYPKFCAFGHLLDTSFEKLGGERIFSIGEGDELNGQEESFKEWARACFKVSVNLGLEFVTFHAIWSTLYFCSIHTFEASESFEITIVEKCIFIKNTLLHNSYLRVLA